jgi:hypothetical protein
MALCLLAGAVFATPVKAQVNGYGGYTAEGSHDPESSHHQASTILIPEAERLTKPLKDYTSASCPTPEWEGCEDMPALPCHSAIKVLGQAEGMTYLFLQEEAPRGTSMYCADQGTAYIVIQKDNTTGTPLLEIPAEGCDLDAALYTVSGRNILDITYCANGTGGCSDELYILSKRKGWIPLTRDESWDLVYQNMPKGYEPHKSDSIDFKTMHWDREIWDPKNDPNARGSGLIHMDLSIKDDQLHVDQYRYETGIGQ